MDLALNNQQCLICYKTKPNQTKPNTTVYCNRVSSVYLFKMIVNFIDSLALKTLTFQLSVQLF